MPAKRKRKAAKRSRAVTFSPPPGVDDMDACVRNAWHRDVAALFAKNIAGLAKRHKRRPQFYSPADVPAGVAQHAVEIGWSGFPRGLLLLYERKRAMDEAEKLATMGFANAMIPPNTGFNYVDPFRDHERDVVLRVRYRLQDEYLEWRCERDERDRIRRVTFTCESPEYWRSLAKHDPRRVLDLYRKYVSPDVQWHELCWKTRASNAFLHQRYRAGDYNPWNRWNTAHGIMHTTHPNNKLEDGINLTANATVLRTGRTSRYVMESLRLVSHSVMGTPIRASDPQIGSAVNLLAQTGARVALADPVGLYIDHVDPNCVTDADGRPAPNHWRVLRGDAGEPGSRGRTGRILRLEYAVPEHAGYTVSDLFVDGERITCGGQLAAHVHMKVVAAYYHDGRAPNPPRAAVGIPYRLRANIDVIAPFPIDNLEDYDTQPPQFEPAFPGDASFRERRPRKRTR